MIAACEVSFSGVRSGKLMFERIGARPAVVGPAFRGATEAQANVELTHRAGAISSLGVASMLDPRAAEKCQTSGHPGHRVVVYVMRNGAEHFCAWCFACDKNVTRDVDRLQRSYYPRALVVPQLERRQMTQADLIRITPDSGLRICYACSQMAPCEDDHVAERTIHGELAERLPIVPLCRECHDLKTSNLQQFMDKLRRRVA